MFLRRVDALSSAVQIALFVSAADLKYRWRNDDTTVVNGPRPKSEGASTSMFIYALKRLQGGRTKKLNEFTMNERTNKQTNK